MGPDAGGPGSLGTALAALRASGALPAGNATDPAKGVVESPDGAVRIDARAGTFAVATPRTAGVAGPAGTALDRPGTPLRVAIRGAWAAVWAASLDGQPLDRSARLLVAHCTDLKNSGDRFRGRDRTVLEAWGRLPYLVRAGTATIRLARPDAASLAVWRLSLSGKRVARVPATAADGALEFTASTATSPAATFFYEVAARP